MWTSPYAMAEVKNAITSVAVRDLVFMQRKRFSTATDTNQAAAPGAGPSGSDGQEEEISSPKVGPIHATWFGGEREGPVSNTATIGLSMDLSLLLLPLIVTARKTRNHTPPTTTTFIVLPQLIVLPRRPTTGTHSWNRVTTTPKGRDTTSVLV